MKKKYDLGNILQPNVELHQYDPFTYEPDEDEVRRNKELLEYLATLPPNERKLF